MLDGQKRFEKSLMLSIHSPSPCYPGLSLHRRCSEAGEASSAALSGERGTTQWQIARPCHWRGQLGFSKVAGGSPLSFIPSVKSEKSVSFPASPGFLWKVFFFFRPSKPKRPFGPRRALSGTIKTSTRKARFVGNEKDFPDQCYTLLCEASGLLGLLGGLLAAVVCGVAWRNSESGHVHVGAKLVGQDSQ